MTVRFPDADFARIVHTAFSVDEELRPELIERTVDTPDPCSLRMYV
jgi:hypothetical protein